MKTQLYINLINEKMNYSLTLDYGTYFIIYLIPLKLTLRITMKKTTIDLANRNAHSTENVISKNSIQSNQVKIFIEKFIFRIFLKPYPNNRYCLYKKLY